MQNIRAWTPADARNYAVKQIHIYIYYMVCRILRYLFFVFFNNTSKWPNLKSTRYDKILYIILLRLIYFPFLILHAASGLWFLNYGANFNLVSYTPRWISFYKVLRTYNPLRMVLTYKITFAFYTLWNFFVLSFIFFFFTIHTFL